MEADQRMPEVSSRAKIDEVTQELMLVLRAGGVIGVECDKWQVRDIEQQLEVQLPASYKAFLLLAGSGFAAFEGSHYAVEDELQELQKVGRRVLQKDGGELPSGAFVFFVHHGYVVRFFLLNDGNDPSVYEYVQGWAPIKQLAARFSEFVLQEVRQWKELKERGTDGGHAGPP